MSEPELRAEIERLLTEPREPTVAELRPIITAWYAMPGNGAGGSLHIVLDDSNTDRESVEFCRGYAEQNGDALGVLLADLLLTCTEEQLDELKRPARLACEGLEP